MKALLMIGALMASVIVGLLAWCSIHAQIIMVMQQGGMFCWGNPPTLLFWTMMVFIVISVLYTALSFCRMVLTKYLRAFGIKLEWR